MRQEEMEKTPEKRTSRGVFFFLAFVVSGVC